MIRRRRTSGKRVLLAVLATVAVVAADLVVGLAGGTAAQAATNHPTLGRLTNLTQYQNGIKYRGWAYDPDTTAYLSVRIRVDGVTKQTVTASVPSPALQKAHPSWGPRRAFSNALALPAGTHTVCADVLNYPSKTARISLGCLTITLDYDPVGAINSATQSPGHLSVTGWAYDPNSPTIYREVILYVDSQRVASMNANLVRTDVAKAHPDAGPNHGFAFVVPITEGTHTICAEAINYGLGTSRDVQCVTRVINFSPVGGLTHIYQGLDGKVRVIGWASDPDTTAPISVQVTSDGTTLGTVVAKLASYSGHGFDTTLSLPQAQWAPATRSICAVGINAGTYGTTRAVACAKKALNYNPTATITTAAQQSPGIKVAGWATDPDTSAALTVQITVDGTLEKTMKADAAAGAKPDHGFVTVVPATNGSHTVCVVAVNALAGSGNSPAACKTVSLNFNPFGGYETATRVTNSTSLQVTGWAVDPDTTGSIQVQVSVDGTLARTATAGLTRTDIGTKYGDGTKHGFSIVVPATDGEHHICVTAVNVLGGTANTSLGCKIVIAVHPVAPSAVQGVTATAGYGGAVITWTPPTSDGGAPWSSYTITSAPGGVTVKAGAGDTSATLLGLKPKTTYTFSVVATNVAGTSVATVSNSTTTQASPPAQTTPAPISTSRYVRNISTTSTTDMATMKQEGATDAYYNPSGHGYLILLDIGGQDETRGGVVLSAGVRFVTYAALVKNLESYVDGYASKQKPSAPITIAIGTNNDIDVSKTAGADWANKVIDPVVAYARKYPNILIAGANDIEPGFSATYSQTKSWLGGYLGATTAPFVFNGSADGCSWTTAGRGCNNGWTMSGLYYLAGGAAPTRIINLPQIYNTTMAAQWRYISRTGVNAGDPKINFGGALTEWTACQQAGGCGSLTGNYAWTTMWNELRADPKLTINSLPYSTDLRIDR